MAKPLLAVADGDYALRVAVPCEIIDAARYYVVLACKQLLASLSSNRCLLRQIGRLPFVAPSPAQSHTRTVPETSPLAT